MHNLRSSLEVLFRKVSPDLVIQACFSPLVKGMTQSIDSKHFIRHVKDKLPYYSYDEAVNIYKRGFEMMGEDPEFAGITPTVFHLLVFFGKKVLVERGMEPFVQYEHLLRWRKISHSLGEDLFTTAYFAHLDVISGYGRNFFSWRPVISSDNIRLKNMLQQGIAENHFHLKGSSPHFLISWISLMNKVSGHRENFDLFLKEGKLEKESFFTAKIAQSDLYTQVKRAAMIRLYLFQMHCLPFSQKRGGDLYQKIKKAMGGNGRDSQEHSFEEKAQEVQAMMMDMFLVDLENDIEIMRYQHGRRFLFKEPSEKVEPEDNLAALKPYDPGPEAIPDYAIPKNVSNKNHNDNLLLYGERYLMYTLFLKTFSGTLDGISKELFYAYLLIKEEFREEVVQVNQEVGFENFQYYQDRKQVFLKDGSIYEKLLHSMSVKSSSSNQQIKSFETRITPSDTVEGLKSKISKTDSYIGSKEHFYVIHHIKLREKLPREGKWAELLFAMNPRNHFVRELVKRQAYAFIGLRKGLYKEGVRVYGLDAASTEFACRPEVFAQVLRYQKHHRLGSRFDFFPENLKPKVPNLWLTYHAGEDFFDLADGLRAIDEAIFFFNMRQGDRIGHALALGIDAYDFYEFKNKKILLPKQWMLDNIAWVLAKIRKYNISHNQNLIFDLEKQFNTLYNEIYDRKVGQYISPLEYYEACKLRGDNPELYIEGSYTEKKPLNYFQRCAIADHIPELDAIRKREELTKLYHLYHYDRHVRTEGRKIYECFISEDYIEVIHQVQNGMQREIAFHQIGIEANPSSNVLISTFKRYDKHPLMRFFNMGLTTDPEELANCPQLFVSINTDDQGVFGTYLENEYALMARALEGVKDENGKKKYHSAMIFKWLDHIRKMGVEQSFKGYVDDK